MNIERIISSDTNSYKITSELSNNDKYHVKLYILKNNKYKLICETTESKGISSLNETEFLRLSNEITKNIDQLKQCNRSDFILSAFLEEQINNHIQKLFNI